MTTDQNEQESFTTQLGTDPKLDIDEAQSERRPVLTSLRGELLATPIPLERDVVTIGRSLDADVRLNDSKASRLHVKISAEHLSGKLTRFHLTDLGSTNGTI